MNTRKVTVEFHPADAVMVTKLEEEIRMVTGMIIEILETNPAAVLSPYFREAVVERARRLQDFHSRLRRRLYVDNPGSSPIDRRYNTEVPVQPLNE